jgi:hypothetical protein
MFVVGQTVFAADPSAGTDHGTFEVISKTGLTVIGLRYTGAPGDTVAPFTIGSGGQVTSVGATGALAAALPTIITDNSTGSATDTIAAGVGVLTVPLYVNLADLANADLITAYTPGYKFKILGVNFVVGKAVTTAAKLATLTPKISGVALTGGALALTSANCTPQGIVINSTAPVTALNEGSDSATISITGSAVTTFIEGAGWIMIQIQNMDTADAVASLSDHVNDLITSLT